MLESIANILIGPFAFWAPYIFGTGIFLTAIWFYVKKYPPKRYWFIIFAYIGFRIIFALFLSVSQYSVWTGSEFTEIFINSPLDPVTPSTFITNLLPWLFESPLGFWAFYSWGRFWYNIFILLMATFAFWAFLKVLKRHKERFFDIGEVELGFLAALLAGWPGFIIFIPLVFLSVILVSIFRLIFYKEAYTTLGVPFLLGGATAFLFGKTLVKLLGLGAYIV